jgi:hypothetical protein
MDRGIQNQCVRVRDNNNNNDKDYHLEPGGGVSLRLPVVLPFGRISCKHPHPLPKGGPKFQLFWFPPHLLGGKSWGGSRKHQEHVGAKQPV